jgi:hypothetical protein
MWILGSILVKLIVLFVIDSLALCEDIANL